MVKIALVIPEIRQGPCEHAPSEFDIFGMKVFQFEKGDDALGDAMHVDWIGPIVKVIRSGVVAEKLISIEFESSAKRLVKLRRVQAFADVSQRTEVVARVKVVHPGKVVRLAVEPGTVNALTPD